MLIVLKSYLTLSEAAAMQALLRSEGLECQLKDEHSVVMAPFLANAIGGIKLMVEEEDISLAVSLLKDAGYIKEDPGAVERVKKNKSLLILIIVVAAIVFYFIAKTIPK